MITDIITNSNSNPVVMEEAIMMTDENFSNGVLSADNFTVKPVVAVAIKKTVTVLLCCCKSV